MKGYGWLIIIGLAMLMLAFLYLWRVEAKKASMYDKQVKAVTDTLHTFKTKDGRNAAYISVITGEKKDIEDLLSKTDSRLAEALKTTKNVKYITTTTVKTKTDTTFKTDTITVNGKLTFNKEIVDPYYTAKVGFKGDSLSLSVTAIDTLDFTHSMKPNGFLKPKSYVVTATLRNPKANVVGLRSYEITTKPKTGLKILGVAAVVVGTILLVK